GAQQGEPRRSEGREGGSDRGAAASADKDRRDDLNRNFATQNNQAIAGHRRLLWVTRADINRCTNRHRTAETFGQILLWLLETVRLRSAPELAVGARAEN